MFEIIVTFVITVHKQGKVIKSLKIRKFKAFITPFAVNQILLAFDALSLSGKFPTI
jgi:hypothetical protein